MKPSFNHLNLPAYLLSHSAEEEVEINFSDEFDVIMNSILLGIHDDEIEHHLIHPEFRSKVIEAIIEEPNVEIEFVTERDGHKLRGKKRHVKAVLKRAISKVRK